MSRKLVAGIISGAIVAGFGGCTTATVSLPDGTRVEFTRFASDAALELSPDRLTYSSSPSAIAQQNAQTILGQVLGLALQGALPGARGMPPQYQRPYQPQAWPMALMMSEAGL